MSDEPKPAKPPAIAVQVGGRRLSGAASALVLLALVAAIVLVVVAVRPRFAWSPLWISAALWVAFFTYWAIAAKNASMAKSAEPAASRARHQRLLNLSLLLLFLRLPYLDARWLPASRWLVAAGLALHAGGFAFAAWARRHLGRHWSAAVTAKVDHDLIRTGPYRRIRHPIYTAMFLMYGGTALVSGELHALLALGIVAYAYARKIPLEEASLSAEFGAAYEDYRRASGALLPRLF